MSRWLEEALEVEAVVPKKPAEAPDSSDVEARSKDPWAEAAAAQRAKAESQPAAVTTVDHGEPHPWDAFFDTSLRKRTQQRTKEAKKIAAEDSGDWSQGPSFDKGPGHRGHREIHQTSDRVDSPLTVGQAHLNDERISHILGRVLRYHFENLGLSPTQEGWISLPELMSKIPELHGIDEERIRSVASHSTSMRGQRFQVREDTGTTGRTEIKALYRYPPEIQRHRGVRRRKGGWGFLSEQPNNFDSSWQYYSRPQRRLGFSHGPALDTDDEDPLAGKPDENIGLPTEGSSTSSSWAGSEGIGHSAELSIKQEEATRNSSPPSTDAAPVWKRYLEPGSDRCWFMNETTEEAFYADDPESGWEQYMDSHGKPWWEHQASGRHFYEAQC